MLRFSRAKILAVILLSFASIYYTLPSFLTDAQRRAIDAAVPGAIPRWMLPIKAIVLGLDLQGGSHLLLEVDSAGVMRGQVNGLRDDVRRILREERVAAAGGIGVLPRGVQIRVSDAGDRGKLLPKLRALAQPGSGALLGPTGPALIEISEGEGGSIQLVMTEAGQTDRVRRAVEQSIEVVRRRVDALGTVEPNIQRQGADRIVVQVPGLRDPQELKSVLSGTAKLEFRFVSDTSGGPDVENIPSREAGGGILPVDRRIIVEGENLIDAQPGFDQRSGQPIINFRFNIAGAQRFGEATTNNVGRALAIVEVETKVGGEIVKRVISSPRIIQPITGGQGQISGSFTVETANTLAIQLRSGALPAALTIVEERSVGAGLGQDSIEAGKTAFWVSALLVMGFMFATYGQFGFFANIALLVHVLLIFALTALLGATMTLPGIAGIVLTIGTAVDANVLIYERIREESRAGRSMVSALEAGFNRAFATIIDSNVTMFIAAAILFFLGTGPVRGFAVTLILGIITSVVTAVTMTRMMIALWYRYAKPTRIPF